MKKIIVVTLFILQQVSASEYFWKSAKWYSANFNQTFAFDAQGARYLILNKPERCDPHSRARLFSTQTHDELDSFECPAGFYQGAFDPKNCNQMSFTEKDAVVYGILKKDALLPEWLIIQLLPESH